jgi:hypothetical protein
MGNSSARVWGSSEPKREFLDVDGLLSSAGKFVCDGFGIRVNYLENRTIA